MQVPKPLSSWRIVPAWANCEEVAGVSQGHFVLLGNGLGEVQFAVDVGGVNWEGGVEPTDGA